MSLVLLSLTGCDAPREEDSAAPVCARDSYECPTGHSNTF